jgi:protein-disulfide isomerase
MNVTRVISAVCVSAALWGAFGSTQTATCPALTEREKTKLIDYVQMKYGLAGKRLRVVEESHVGATCYRKLLFQSQEQAKPFRVELFLSPDRRFLARDLLDTTTPPVVVSGEPAATLLPDVARGNFPVLGKPDAPVSIAVFSDFECPFCARFATMMRKEVLPAEGQHLRFVFRQFPLPMHPWARAAAEASACAYQQKNDYFWSFHDFIFDRQRELTQENFQAKVREFAHGLSGFDYGKFESCVSKEETKGAIDREVAFGNDSGIHGTPTVFINGRQARVGDAEQMLSLIRQLVKNPQAAIPSSEPPARDARPPQLEIADVAEGNNPTLGPANALVTLTVFSDFQCPYCAEFSNMLRREVLPVANGKLRWVFRYFPLSMHSWARASAEAAACADQQKSDYFWAFHDFFFEHQRELTPANLRQTVLDRARGVAGLDQERFRRCVEQGGTRALIERDVAFANKNGIEATPTVFVNGRETEIVAREQVLTLIRELSANPSSAVQASRGPSRILSAFQLPAGHQ